MGMTRIFCATTLVTILVAASSSVSAASDPAGKKDENSGEGAPRIQITVPAEATRPAALPPLYVALAGLQAYDGYSTLRGVQAGARETNPLVGGMARQPIAFWTVKALSTVSSIYFAEQLWRQHKKTQAIVTMVVANGVMAAVAARNAAVRARQ